jgi:hypothetical protein
MLSVLPVASIVSYFKIDGARRRDVVRRSLAIFLLSLFLTGAAVALKFDVVSSQLRLLMGFQREGLERWGESFTSTFLFQTHPVITLATAASLFLALRKRDMNYAIVFWLPFLMVLFQIKRIRYMLPLMPLMTLMASYGLRDLLSHEYRKTLIACIVAASLATGYFAYLPFLNSLSAVNLKHAGEFLDTLEVAVVEVVTLPQKDYPINPAINTPLLDLFTQKKISFKDAPGESTSAEPADQSRFRFSWEYRNPGYYEPGARDAERKRAVVLIFARPDEGAPPELADAVSEFAHSRAFLTANPLFYYQTLVRIYW